MHDANRATHAATYRLVETWHYYDGLIMGIVEDPLGQYIAVMEGDDVVSSEPRTYKLYPISEPHTRLIKGTQIVKDP